MDRAIPTEVSGSLFHSQQRRATAARTATRSRANNRVLAVAEVGDPVSSSGNTAAPKNSKMSTPQSAPRAPAIAVFNVRDPPPRPRPSARPPAAPIPCPQATVQDQRGQQIAPLDLEMFVSKPAGREKLLRRQCRRRWRRQPVPPRAQPRSTAVPIPPTMPRKNPTSPPKTACRRADVMRSATSFVVGVGSSRCVACRDELFMLRRFHKKTVFHQRPKKSSRPRPPGAKPIIKAAANKQARPQPGRRTGRFRLLVPFACRETGRFVRVIINEIIIHGDVPFDERRGGASGIEPFWRQRSGRKSVERLRNRSSVGRRAGSAARLCNSLRIIPSRYRVPPDLLPRGGCKSSRLRSPRPSAIGP